MNSLVKTETTALATMQESELLDVLESSLYPGASKSSIRMVLGYCKAAGLDPMRKPVHIVPMWDGKEKRMRDVVMPGIGLYRTDAARTGEYAGMTEPEYGSDVFGEVGGVRITYPTWCRVTVTRRMASGHLATYTAKELWLENYATKGKDSEAPNTMWKKRPYAQLAKCAEAQALRKAFPEVGSQPTADEMEGKSVAEEFRGTTIDASTGEIVGKTAPAMQEAWSDDLFAQRLPEWRKAIAAGKATADAVIAKARTKHPLTDAQEAAIRAPDEPAEIPEKDLIVMTFAQVADRMRRADSMDKLAEAASLIGAVQNEAHRAELSALYEQRGTELA